MTPTLSPRVYKKTWHVADETPGRKHKSSSGRLCFNASCLILERGSLLTLNPKIMYAYLVSYPQLAFAIRTLAQFMHNPGKAHWEGAKRILRYLQGAKDLCLVLGGSDRGLEGYTDTDHASQPDRHSISGYAFVYGGTAISWSSK